MPPHRGAPTHRLVGKQPIVLSIAVVLILANTVASLALAYLGKYFIPEGIPSSHVCAANLISDIRYGVPVWICWYANRYVWITLILFGIGAVMVFIYRKRFERVR